MNRIPALPLSCALLILAACDGGSSEIPTTTETLPSSDLSTSEIDFGEVGLGSTLSRTFTLRNGGDLPMGVGGLRIMTSDGMEQSFAISWDEASMTCPEASSEEAAEAEAKADDTGDTGAGGGGGGSTDEPDHGGFFREALVMQAGCTLPITVTFSPIAVGDLYAAIEITTVTADVPEPEGEDAEEVEPEYFRDPDLFRQVVIVHGKSVQGTGNILVRSPTVDMGHHYTGETFRSFVYVYNVGDGDLNVQEPVVCRSHDCDPATTTYTGPHECIECTADQDPCHDAFTLVTTDYDEDGLLPQSASTLFEVEFSPTDLDPAFCPVYLASDDVDTPMVEIDVKGNAGTDPTEREPTVAVRYPPVGYVHQSGEPLMLEVDMFDFNQPANTLICKVRSLVGETKIADCVPDSQSGHVFVPIDTELLEEGTDTLLITVTDQAENRAFASTTIMWKAMFPPSDDDGDGWGNDPGDGLYVDCDDTDTDVYPSAAELPDGKDNDCDGAIDELSIAGDDDGDSVTEMDGDCDDFDSDTYPGAMEKPDQKDNNCDGVVDEQTSLFDDDGDGFTELDLDCSDTDATVNPVALEYCDDLDNNCDGRVDEAGCIELSSAPTIIGDIQMSRTAIGAGESVTMTVLVHDPDGDELTFQWQDDPDLVSTGHVAISSASAQTITWTAPKALDEDSPGVVYQLVVTVTDANGEQDWAFGDIAVYPEPVTTEFERVEAEQADAGGCGGGDESGEEGTSDEETSDAALLLLPLAGAFALRRRRRQGAR